MDTSMLFLILPAVALIIWLIVRAAQAAAERNRRRLAGLAAFAATNGYQFSAEDRWNLDSRYNGVDDIGTGHDRYAFEVLCRGEPCPIFVFQYHYKTWETRTVTRTDSDGHSHTETETYEEDHWRRYLVIETGAHFPSLVLRHEGWFDKLKGLIGFDDINFESEEFSRRYFCKSDNREFAYAVVHPQMIEWLLPQELAVQLRDGYLLMSLSGQHSAETCGQALQEASGFINRIPPFVWQDYGQRERLEIPTPQAVATPEAAPAA